MTGPEGSDFRRPAGRTGPERDSAAGEIPGDLGGELECLEVDGQANDSTGPRISTATSKVSAWLIPTNEELMIARHTGLLLGLIAAHA